MRRVASVVVGLMMAAALAGADPTEAQPGQDGDASSVAWNVEQLDRLLAATVGSDEVHIDDMIFKRATITAYRDRLSGLPHLSKVQGTIQSGTPLWSGGNVSYRFDATVSAAHQEDFLNAAAEWSAFGNVRFVVRTTEPNYITVKDVPGLSGGTASVGMQGGEQFINIGSTSWQRLVVLHELGHALGLVHEHQRADRDAYVTILTANIQPGYEGAFVLLPGSTSSAPYDFLSVMHYSRTAFSVAPATKNTMEPKAAYASFADQMGRQLDQPQSRFDRVTIAALYGPPAIAPSGIVTTTRESGPGSLRTAMYYAFDRGDANPGGTTTVQFRIPPGDPNFNGSVARFQPRAALPALGNGTTVDGQTQTAFGGDTNPAGPEVLLSGAGLNASGFVFRGAESSVRNVVVNGFLRNGIEILGPAATNNAVTGCFIGTDAAGTAAVPNSNAGVSIRSAAHGNTVGGTTFPARNVISGNQDEGVEIVGVGTDSNLVRGNLIGTTRTGSVALANGSSGVTIGEGARSNEVGADAAGAGNVLSANFAGVSLWGVGTGLNRVAGNLVGVDASGVTAMPNVTSGISIHGGASANVIGTGNTISGNTSYGISISGTGTNSNVVEGSRIGLNAVGSAAVPNGRDGVIVFGGAQTNRIGGSAAGAGNVVSGNTQDGVSVQGTGTDQNVVAGNLIGTTGAGDSAPTPNNNRGVSISEGASGNTVGGQSAGARNVISGNRNAGVIMSGAGTSANTVAGNYVGIATNGTAVVGNSFGVQVQSGASANTVGGSTAGAGNIIAGNANAGVSLFAAGTAGNRVYGNTIGRNAAGAPAPNVNGVSLGTGTTGAEIGGAGLGAGNVIADNTQAGVVVSDQVTGINIRGNAISGNGRLGIDLLGPFEGPAANDTGDGDTGANGLQNYPVVTSAASGTRTKVDLTFDGAPNTTVAIDVFWSPVADPSGFGEGATFLGSTSLTTAANGRAQGTVDFAPAIAPVGAVVTATATDPTGNTSEFSRATRVVPFQAPADFDGDADTDISVYRPGTGQWLVRDQSAVSFGTTGDVPVPADYDGNGTTDVAIFRASVGGWYRNGGPTTFFGVAGDIPVPCDYDGDGRADIAIFRPSVGGWYRNGAPTTYFGLAGDIPVPADYNGDGTCDIAVFRPSVGGWYRVGAPTVFYGLSGDVPVPANYDGTPGVDFMVFRPSVGGWYHSVSGPQFLGVNGDVPVPGKYAGGLAQRAVFRPSTGAWFLQSQSPVFFGASADVPLPLAVPVRQTLFAP